jgi:hypothetical protein
MKKERNIKEKIEYILEICNRYNIKCIVERFDNKEDYIKKYGIQNYNNLISK